MTLPYPNIPYPGLVGDVQQAAEITANFVYLDGLPGVVGANPTATASDTAVNGVATTFLRSDGAPAIQKATSSVFGIVKVDGTTITASSGVISAAASYASGTWTPTIYGGGTAGTPTYVAQVGSYEKIGRLLTCRFNVQISAKGGMTGTAFIGGIPFTATSTSGDYGSAFISDFQGITSAYYSFQGIIQPSASAIQLVESSPSLASTQSLDSSKLGAATTIIGFVNYRTN